MATKRTNKKFTREEDDRLRQLVHEFGESSWDEVSARMKTRNMRQCHDRWVYFLSPKINNNPWTVEEDMRLIRLTEELQGRWVRIAKKFRGRNDTQIKNRWNHLKKTNHLPDVKRAKKKEVATLGMPIFQPDQFGTINDILDKLSADIQMDNSIACMNDMNDFLIW